MFYFVDVNELNEDVVFLIGEKSYPLQSVAVEVNGTILEPSQDNGYDVLMEADSLALVIGNERYPFAVSTTSDDAYELLLEMVYPT